MPVSIPPPAIIYPAPQNPIGCNLDGNVDWNTAHIWTDATHAFRKWGKKDKAWEEDNSLVYTAEGYPISDAAALSYLNNYPNGTYTLTWQGGGEVQIGGMGRRGEVKRHGNAASADVVLKHDNPDGLSGGMIFIVLSGNRASDPIHDVHLYAPGFGPGEKRFGENFSDEFLRRVRPFASVRFMDWASTNNSEIVRWEDRTTTGMMIQTTQGVAWEYIIDLANHAGRDAWINVPAMASDDYVTKLATLVHGTLDPRLKVRVEYSNEVWNAIFKQFGQNMVAARANPAITKPDDFSRAAQQYALRSAQVSTIFQNVFGKDADRLIGVYGGQTSNNYWHDTGLEFLATHGHEPSRYFKELAIAGYAGNDLGKPPKGAWTVDDLFADCEQFTATTLGKWIRDAKVSADKYHLKLVAYEAGQHLSGNNTVPPTLSVAANNDPRMYVLYHHLYEVWNQNSGGGLWGAFSHIGGGWGLLDGINQAGSPKWDAVMDLVLPPGDVTLDGQVTFEDFQVIQRNLGKKGMWREQGDLNGDGVVDQKDVEILLKHVKGLTAGQQKEVEAARGK